jgi:tetratricopeptide (TPR) repeat protein
MARTRSPSSSIRFAKLVALATVGLLAAVGLRGERADACGGGMYLAIEDVTTFDPSIVGDWDGLAYNPYESSFGGACDDCLAKAMLADWTTYLTGVTVDDWKKILLTATEADLVSLRAKAAGKSTAAPKGYETSSLWKVPKERAIGALDLVKLARQVEPYATFEMFDPDGNPKTVQAPPIALGNAARDGMKATKDPFLAQRFAFQALRVAFYQREWNAVVAFYDRNTAVLSGPSQDLAWRARHYLAGALGRRGTKGRANLELARIGANYKPLSGLAVLEFKPSEEADFKESLRLAKTIREKTELWQMVGITKDGIVASQEILRIDPKSNLVGLLLVRELEKAESRGAEMWNMKPDPKEIAAQKKQYAQIDQLAQSLIARGGDRPWLMELISGHLAAKRGDLTAARTRINRALAARPGDPKVASQARASLSVALAASWRLGDGAAENELAAAMAGIDPKFARGAAVRVEVRGKLAKAYVGAGKLVDAEFLTPGSADATDEAGNRIAKGKPNWQQRAFLDAMIARAANKTTPFDKFIVEGSFKPAELQFELGLRYLLDGDFVAAQKLLKPTAKKWGTDPFVIHIVDCHDCDHAKYEKAKWDHANVVDRLIELDAKVKAGGEPGAEAALQIGNVLYNLTYWGNARQATAETHQKTEDASLAMKYYKKAHDLSKNRELKVKAAFLAAKAELGTLLGVDGTAGGLPIPKTWFPVVKQYANTRYYKEVLKECGHFASWVKP